MSNELKLRDYPVLVPPFKVREFETMRGADALQHYEWFISQSSIRCRILISEAAASGCNVGDWNYSKLSLIPVWSWAALFAKEDPRPPKSATSAPLPTWCEVAGLGARELTIAAAGVALDVSFYFAETFLKRFPHQVRWSLWKEPGHALNRPILFGFKIPLVPWDITIASMWKAINGKYASDDLLNAFEVWEQDLVNPAI